MDKDKLFFCSELRWFLVQENALVVTDVTEEVYKHGNYERQKKSIDISVVENMIVCNSINASLSSRQDIVSRAFDIQHQNDQSSFYIPISIYKANLKSLYYQTVTDVFLLTELRSFPKFYEVCFEARRKVVPRRLPSDYIIAVQLTLGQKHL